MANRGLIPLLVTMMLVTGVCNTILNKYQVTLASPRMTSWVSG
jgi:hypothetical protein